MSAQIEDLTPRTLSSTKQTLHAIHSTLHRSSWHGRAWSGWNQLSQTHTPAKTTAIKATSIAASLFLLSFAGMAGFFGVTAALAAPEEYNETGRAPVIGHLAEWTMLAIFVSAYLFQIGAELGRLGTRQEIDHLYDTETGNTDRSPEQREALYRDKLQLINSTKPNQWFVEDPLPQTNLSDADISDLPTDSLLALDTRLAPLYRQISSELDMHTARATARGWRIIAQDHGILVQTISVLGLATLTVAGIGQMGVYGAGIYWSAGQAIADYHDGENPSIGGHSLEWLAEAVAVGRIFLLGVNEFANVGRAERLIQVFDRHISTADPEERARLEALKVQLYRRIPSGWIVQKPDHLLFRADAMHNAPKLTEVVTV